ncbi:MAG: peptidoglycan editing factor PgeF [Paracoccaceae bacterium]|nr:peptidoglycan editing factor PgeF [Paracoccaceae bacterium]MDE2916797.1 peptidoglycan editing factor PgeF [Paracoccaceae bacterium]
MSPHFITSKLLEPKKHGFFTRKNGFSKNPFQSLNCGLNSRDDKTRVVKNRLLIEKTLGIEQGNLIFLNQKHTSRVIVLENNSPPTFEADGMVTKQKGLGLAILTADCQPIFFLDLGKGIIGAIHAGWKGTLKGVIRNVIREMISQGADVKDIRVVVGPSISKENYEFGKDLRDEFVDNIPASETCFSQISDKKYLFDLMGLSHILLLKEGIKQVEFIDLCTYQNESWFFSCRRSFHRKEPGFGLNASVIVT